VDHAGETVKTTYDRKHDVAYVEFISPSRGVNLAGVPRAAEIEREVRRLGPPIRTIPADVARPSQ
jgi:hypothetical protein